MLKKTIMIVSILSVFSQVFSTQVGWGYIRQIQVYPDKVLFEVKVPNQSGTSYHCTIVKASYNSNTDAYKMLYTQALTAFTNQIQIFVDNDANVQLITLWNGQ